MDMTMSTPAEVNRWRSVNDGVMGGLSSGGPRFENGHMVFAGNINTNGGGFSSIRARVQPGALTDVSAMTFRVKSDGRTYKATFRTDARYGWREISFQTELSIKTAGQWSNVIVPFTELQASVFGRPIYGAEFDPAKVQSIGIIIADGRDGPFQLEVEKVEACKVLE